jgi:predicted metal-binding protein
MPRPRDRIAELVRQAKKAGAADVKVVKPDAVFTATWVRLKCQYGCDGYGACLTCPPYSPEPATTRRMLDEYRTILLVHVTSRWALMRKILPALERSAFLAGFHKAFAMPSGPCNLCKACDLESCRHAELARPSMEACGIDVYATARAAGFSIEVCADESSDENYYGLLVVE